MTINIIIKTSHLANKKYDAIIDGKKTVPFGQKNASDMTQHEDEDRKKRYILRHKKTEHWDNIYTAGFWSRWILWEKTTITDAVKNINQKFKHIHVKYQ